MSQFYPDSRNNPNLEQLVKKGQVYEGQGSKQTVDTLRVEFPAEAAKTITEVETVNSVQGRFIEE